MTWTYRGTTYFAQAEVGPIPGSRPMFADGTIQLTGSTRSYQPNNTDNGRFGSGRGGVVEIDVPRSNVGSPATGAVLSQPAGATYTEEGVPPNPIGSAASLQPVDSGGPNKDYQVGSTCPPKP
jgi:hypothetical protein